MKYSWFFFIPPVVLIAIAIAAWCRYRKHSHDRDLRRVAVIAHTRAVKHLPAYRRAARRYRLLLACAALSFLVSVGSLTAAAARPTLRQEHDTTSENRDIVLCLDVSGSMDAYQKGLLGDFKKIVNSLHKQRIAVTIFDGKPANLIPLTDDYDALMETIGDISKAFSTYELYSPIATTVGTSSSAIGDGVMGCINSLDLSEENLRAKSIIIATDNYYGPQSIDIGQAARYASRYGITFYGIYIGGSFSSSQKNEFINAVKITGGSFFSLADYYDLTYTQSGPVAKAKDSNKTYETIVRQIMDQETEKMKGAPEIVYTDSPNVALYISGISLLIFIGIIWRLRL